MKFKILERILITEDHFLFADNLWHTAYRTTVKTANCQPSRFTWLDQEFGTLSRRTFSQGTTDIQNITAYK